jgi:hypothetical protein
VQEPVGRAPVTVEDELAILAKRLVSADRKVRHSGPQIRIHAVLSRMSVTLMTMLDVVPPWYTRIEGVEVSIQYRPDVEPVERHNLLKMMI